VKASGGEFGRYVDVVNRGERSGCADRSEIHALLRRHEGASECEVSNIRKETVVKNRLVFGAHGVRRAKSARIIVKS
jgi:hypothetical protein